MPISNRSVFAAVLAACFGLAVSATLANVEVWTDKERVILKGDLKGMGVLPPGSKGKDRPTGAKRPQAKPRVANRAPGRCGSARARNSSCQVRQPPSRSMAIRSRSKPASISIAPHGAVTI